MVPREGQLRDLAPPRRGLLRADALGSGSADQPGRGEGQGPRAAERPSGLLDLALGGPAAWGLTSFQLALQAPAARECRWMVIKGTQGASFKS